MNKILVNSLIQNLLFLKKWWVIRHLLFWIFIYLDEFLSFIGVIEPYDEYVSIIISLVFDMIVVYINLYFLIPRFLKKDRLVEYLLLTTLTVVALFGGEYLMEIFYWKGEGVDAEYFVHIFVQTSVTMAAAIAVKVLKEAMSESRLRKEIEKEKLSFELQHLKKQVNPHFLFNVLNGIYIQSQTQQEEVPETIMQLSDLLRYQIYDAEKNDKVFISKEIEFIKNYIALEKIRRENTEIRTSFIVQNQSARIQPLLFISLVENAFKYSVPKSGDQSTIDILLKEKDNKIAVMISNSIGVSPSENGDEGGFGLQNLKKRLELLYPDAHSLIVDVTKDGIFSVKLEISTDEMHHN
tara:strand:- start:2753 stop:3808 length:1056 start_codon:yes stop_codon:yes gene_type:complete